MSRAPLLALLLLHCWLGRWLITGLLALHAAEGTP